MKRNTKHTTTAATITLLGVLLMAGCGGGGSPVAVSSPNQDTLSKKSVETVATATSAELEALLGLRQSLTEMPDSAFASKNTDNWDSRDPRQHEKELLNIIERALDAVNADDFSKAAQILEKQFIPRVDGCDTEKIENDFIGDCTLAASLREAAEDVISTINSLNTSKNGKRSSAAVDWTTFKNSVIQKLNDIGPEITSAPDASFNLPPGNSRNTLLGIIDDAIALMEAGDVDGAKALMENTFYPLTDGGDGGDSSDDLYTAWYYTTPEYTTTMTLVHSVISDTTITLVTVTPGSGRILAGTQTTFSATCTYSNQYEEDCTAAASWTSGNTAVGTVSGGTFTGVAGGETTVSATVQGVTSNTATIKVLSSTSLQDAFNGSYLDPEKWSDVYTNSASHLLTEGGKLVMRGESMEFGQIIPTHAYKIDYLEKLEFEVELDLGTSTGMYHVQGFGMMEGNRTGMAIGLMDGTAVGATPMLYYSSTSDYGTMSATRAMKVRVEYYSGRATIYLNGATTPAASFNAYIDGTYAVFFMYTTSIYSTFDVSFDNFWTNQEEPGDMGITIENLTNPFTVDGSGTLNAGDLVKLSMHALPYQKTVEARLSYAATMATAVVSRPLTEVSPGNYETTFVMPAIGNAEVVAYGTMDLYRSTRVISRKILTTGSAARVLAKTTANTTITEEVPPERPIPDFLLPVEFRNK